MADFHLQAATELQNNAATLAQLADDCRDKAVCRHDFAKPGIRLIMARDWQRDAARVSRIARALMGLEV